MAGSLVPVGTPFTFTSPYTLGPDGWSAEAFAARKGTRARIIGHVTEPSPAFDADTLPMYRIRFEADGVEIEAWPEEVEGA